MLQVYSAVNKRAWALENLAKSCFYSERKKDRKKERKKGRKNETKQKKETKE